MKETDFIAQNKDKWARFEKFSASNNNDPDEVSELFTEITEDLSYAKTFYPRRSVRVYLNQLSQGVFTRLYKQKKQPIGSFVNFWRFTVPLEMYRSRHNLLAAFIFFSLAIFVGAVSQAYNPEFVEYILGKSYVSATEARIQDGNPMGIYGESSQGDMFLRITMNNIRVAFFAFTFGIFYSLGSYVILLSNGIMLGAFQWWFHAKGLLLTSFLAIWIHGAFEISAIVIAGAAGITLGNGLIFPKSFTRMQSLIFSAKRGMIILLSLVPVFIIAGFLESYVTRHYLTMGSWVKAAIIGTSFLIIIMYYVIYPFIVAKRHPDKIVLKEVPRFISKRDINWHEIRKSGAIFTDTFTYFITKIRPLTKIMMSVILPIALILLALIFYLDVNAFNYHLSWNQYSGVLFGTDHDFRYYKFIGWSLILTLILGAVFYCLKPVHEENFYKQYFKFMLKHAIALSIYSVIIFSILIFSPVYLYILLFFISPFLNLIPITAVIEEISFIKAIGKGINSAKHAYLDILLSLAGFIAVALLFSLVISSPFMGVVNLINQILTTIFITFTDHYLIIINLVDGLIYLLYFMFILSLTFMSFAFCYYSANEKATATGLYNKLEQFGKRNRNFESNLDFE